MGDILGFLDNAFGSLFGVIDSNAIFDDMVYDGIGAVLEFPYVVQQYVPEVVYVSIFVVMSVLASSAILKMIPI